jgi:hypothetical protein
MIGFGQLQSRSLLLSAVMAISAGAVACGVASYEVPIDTPIQPKLDVSPFQRVLVAGFVAGGSEEVDANQETVRLLRSQLRTKAPLRVIDADVMPLAEVVLGQNKATGGDEPLGDSAAAGAEAGADRGSSRTVPLPQRIRVEKDLEPYERLFANVAYWKKIGEEYQGPLIVTGTVLFTSHSSSGFVQQEQEVYDQYGRRRVVPVRTYVDRKGFILRPKFVFIDGRTGATLYSESYREEVLYGAQQETPALSSYFELMDRLVPNFLGALSSQKIHGTRVLLK